MMPKHLPGARAREVSRHGGIALVIVLWLVTLLSLLAVGQTAAVRTETLVVGNQVQSAQARAAAYGCIQLGLLELMRPPSARVWAADGEVYASMLAEAVLHIRLADESGKVDLNFATGPRLDALLRAAGVEESERLTLVDAILDWRDPDTLRRPNGAEEPEYRAAALGYAPRNGAFQSIEELTLVVGMSAKLYHALADSITVHSGEVEFDAGLVTGAILQRMLAEGISADATRRDGGAVEPPPAAGVARGGGRVYTISCAAQVPSGVREYLEAVVRLVPARGANVPLHEILVWRVGDFDLAWSAR